MAVASGALGACATGGTTASGPAPATSASSQANAVANTALYQSVSYANTATKGPAIVILPGEVKSNNATFTQRYAPTNIADYAELERTNLSSVLREIELAYNMGDPAKAQELFKKGDMRNTRWIIRFDVLRAEKIAEVEKGFSGGP